MNKTWLRGRLPVAAVVLALLASACGASTSPSPGASGPGASAPGASGSASAPSAPATPRKGGSITVAIEGEPASMDPAFDYDFVSGLAVSSVTEGLLKFCENDTKLCPNLGESWTVSPDGKTYTVKVRQGVKFHDGSTMTVDDVIFSLNRIRNPDLASYVGWMLAKVSDIKAPDSSTVVITLSEPDALLEYALAATSAHVVNKKFVEANGAKYGTPEVGSIGTGPFKFVEWKSGDHQKIARFDDYWDKSGGPYLDDITIKIIAEPSTRVAGLQTGEIDYIINNIPSDQYATVKSDADVDLTFTDSYYGEWITFNTQKPPFDNVKARQAMNYAFNKKAVRELFYGTDAEPTKATLVNPSLWPTLGDAAPWQTAWDALPSYDYDIIVASWGSDFPDPSGNLRPNFASENSAAGGANVSNYHNARVDELLATQNTLVDKGDRAQMLIEAQKIIAADSPIIVTSYPGWPLAVNKRLAGASAASLWYWGSLFKDIYVK